MSEKNVSNAKILRFIEEAKSEIEKANAQDNYCIIVYSTKMTINLVRFVYKSLDDFERRVIGDINTIDEIFGINFQVWYFD